MHYQIYLPGSNGADPGQLAAVGLGDLLRPYDDAPMWFPVDGGPDGRAGQIVTWRSPGDFVPGYRPDRQDWQAADADDVRHLPAGRYWYGVDRRLPVTPDCLRRRRTVDGLSPLVLLDGQAWVFPNVLCLPARVVLDRGRLAEAPRPEWQPIADRGQWALEMLLANLTADTPVPWPEAYRYCAEMLGVNYRVDLEICVRLGLFDRDNLATAISRTLDVARIKSVLDDLEKKNGAVTLPG
jgi:hypothetical protein